jgi:FtsP/CotA-like multicopper oxidase with cupredoxin domain
MHPEIHATKPGNCPKCGMKLVREKSKSAKPKASPKTPVVKKNFPIKTDTIISGQVKHETLGLEQKPPVPIVQQVTYTCTMHPEIHSNKPGICPKCGMKLVPVKSTPVKKPARVKPVAAKPSEVGNIPAENDNALYKPDSLESIKKDTTGADQPQMGNMPDEVTDAPTYIKFEKTYLPNPGSPRVVRYDLYVADTMVTFGKKSKRAIAVNGMIPMPTLTFTEGDTAEIYVHNNLNEETAMHWHGLILPNQYDGVPNLTQMPIKPHTTHLYRFPIIQHGTHWYHSHSGLQEQIGMYGMFIMNERKEWDIPTIPLMISEWIDIKPKEVERSLHAATDWFAVQKGSTQDYAAAIRQGHFATKVTNEWKRMNAMDLTDIYYDNFLLNGKNQELQPQFKAGSKVRLRIANGGASDYFWLSYAGGKITVVATDGNEVQPVEVDRLIIAASETYDVVVTIPDNKSYEFLVTPEDRTRHASLWLGSGEKVAAEKLKRPKYFAGMKMMNMMMDMKGNMIEMGGMKMENQVMDMNTVMYPEITGDEKNSK